MSDDLEREAADEPEWVEGMNIILFWRFPTLEMPEFGTEPEEHVPVYTLAEGYRPAPEQDYLPGTITP